MSTNQNWTLSQDVINKTLNYLYSRPFAEVAQLVQALATELQPQLPKTAPVLAAAPEATDDQVSNA
jgi:hypothetical protein